MKKDKVTLGDILAIKSGSEAQFELPSYAKCHSARNMLSYVKKTYPREDGQNYYTHVNGNIITIGVTPKTRIRRPWQKSSSSEEPKQ